MAVEPKVAPGPGAAARKAKVNQISLNPSTSVRELSDLVGVEPVDIIKQLMRNGVMATINQTLDFKTAQIMAAVFGFKAVERPATAQAAQGKAKAAGEATRPPVVTIMGHVDHGKTSLLDAIRQSNVVATEAGAITQHIGAYQVDVSGRKVTFLDTPGHEAFTAMRARGARATDIAVIVVGADDGVMPQTVEAINHARAAGVAIVVALNKIDKANANPDKVKKQLADVGLNLEEWGGDTVCVPVSAKKRTGIKELLENLLLVADILELKGNPNKNAEGVVIEAQLDKQRGSSTTLLVQSGTLRAGDILVAGNTFGKVKAMVDDSGRPLKKVEPASPAVVLGLKEVPSAGDTFKVVATEKEARELVEKAGAIMKELSYHPVNLSNVFAQASSGEIKDLNIVLKTDVQGSIEPIRTSLEKLGTEKINVKVIHSASGTITEGDVLLALASRGIIMGFNSQPEPGAKAMAEKEGISIRNYSIIYDIADDVKKALEGMLEPTYTETVEGAAEVKAVFESKRGKAAGSLVREGRVTRDVLVRIIRNKEVIKESRVNSLKRFKEDAREVVAGLECGIGVEGFNDFKPGDILQFYRREKVS
jgi:translation initiation factor IF-2